jgi:hypothetical protein
MAISNLAYPSGTPTCQDALWHVFNTSVTGVTDFRYVFDVFVGGVQQSRVKIYPEPSNNQGYFDAGPIVRNTMTYEWFEPTDNILTSEPNVSGQAAQTYQYRIGEEYSGVTYLNLVSGNVTAYNWSAPLLKRRVSDITAYSNKAMTTRPAKINASIGDNIFIGAKDVSGLTIVTYNQNNTQITSTTFNLGGVKPFAELNIGSPALNKSTTIIDSSVKYYTATIGTSVFTIYLDCNPKYTSYNLHFMNRLGMFDTAKFGLASRLNLNVDRKEFEKRDYTLGSNSVTYYNTNNKYNAGKVNYLNQRDYVWRLTMDAPTDAEYEWLEELIYSSQIFMEIEGYYYPVTIALNNFEISKYVNNRLRVLELDVKMNTKRYSQLR